MHAGLKTADEHIAALEEMVADPLLRQRHATRQGMPCQHEVMSDEPVPDARPDVALGTIAKEWGRIGCTGFGGPPTHIAMLRRLAVEREGWLDETEFEDAIAATNLLPGPASTQLAIFCAWRLRGVPGALVGGACFICPGLAAIIVLAAVFLASNPPVWIKGAALGAGAAVAPVALGAAIGAGPGQLADGRVRSGRGRARWVAYAAVGAAASATVGTYLVLVAARLRARSRPRCQGACGRPRAAQSITLAPLWPSSSPVGSARSCWVALKVGALSFGGGFVIIPLMQADAVHHYHWMTNSQFLNGVALGQITPGPVVQTVCCRRLRRRRGGRRAPRGAHRLRSFLRLHPRRRSPLRRSAHQPRGAGVPRRCRTGRHRRHRRRGHPAGARDLPRPWQVVILAGALVVIVGLRRSVVLTLVARGVGAIGAARGLPLGNCRSATGSRRLPPRARCTSTVPSASKLRCARVRLLRFSPSRGPGAGPRANRGRRAPTRARLRPAGSRPRAGRT